jgi:hypothetical protein
VGSTDIDITDDNCAAAAPFTTGSTSTETATVQLYHKPTVLVELLQLMGDANALRLSLFFVYMT